MRPWIWLHSCRRHVDRNLPSKKVLLASSVTLLTCCGLRHFSVAGVATESSLTSGKTAGRLVIVGDVHGCSDELKDLLEAADFHKRSDDLIFVGDLIGKGPSPREVVRIAREFSAKAVQGNHEYNLLRWRRRGAPLPDPENKIKESYASTVKDLEEDDWQWLGALPLMLHLDLPKSPLPVVVVHAGLVPGIPMDQQKPYDLVHLRSIDAEGHGSKLFDAGAGAWAKNWPGPTQVIFGHDARRGLQKEAFAIGLDTGAVYGDKLTALLLPKSWDKPLASLDNSHFLSVKSHRAYASKSDSKKG